MCMGGGGSGSSARSLRRGQLATQQRGVSTSRVAGHDRVTTWSEPVTTTTRTWIAAPGTVPTPGLAPKQQAELSRNQQLSAALSPNAPQNREFTQARQAISKASGGRVFGIPAPKPGTKIALPNPQAFLGNRANTVYRDDQGKVLSGTAIKMGGTQQDGVTKTSSQAFVEVPTKAEAAKGYWKEETKTTQTYTDSYVARMDKNANQRVAVDDGSQARRKSRSARSSVANANTQSRVSGKRPKGGLRISTSMSGVQVPGT